jgi:broad specificity phosphatase PhoE
MPTRVLLLRHAESADPLVFHGAESDVGLSPRGVRQAEALAPLLAGLSPHAAISSAMRRAVTTATPIARACGLPLEIEPALHERRVGALSGTPTGIKDGVWPATLKRWLAGETSHAPPGAESYDDLRARVVPAWERLMAGREGQTLVVMAHGVVIRVLLLELLEDYTLTDWHRLSTANAGINELVREGSGPWQALRLNDVPPEARP